MELIAQNKGLLNWCSLKTEVWIIARPRIIISMAHTKAGGTKMPKVLVINGSPFMAKGNTAKVLTPFIEGMKQAGASVELVYAKRLKVKPCTGTFYCWDENPGQCIIHDDMQSLYTILREAETLVLATPVYIPLPGEMQNVINRLCPLIEPKLDRIQGRTRAKFRTDVKIKRIALVATSGWWEKGNFGTVLRIVKELARDASVEFAGAALRPHASLMAENPEKAVKIYETCHQAGFQLVKTGKIPEDLSRIIGRPLISEKKIRRRSNDDTSKAEDEAGKNNPGTKYTTP